MKNFLESRRGARILAIIELGPNRAPTHFYQGSITAVGDGFLILRDDQLAEIAIATDKIVAVKMLTEAQAGLDVTGATLDGFER
jgi:hypothetical protein